MNRRDAIRSSIGALFAGVAGSLGIASAKAAKPSRDEIVRFIYDVQGNAELEDAIANMAPGQIIEVPDPARASVVKEAQYDELAAMILVRAEYKVDMPDEEKYGHIHSLFRFETNGYCTAMRRAYPEDRDISYDHAWALARANGRVPLSPDRDTYPPERYAAPVYVLVEPDVRTAEVNARRARIGAYA